MASARINKQRKLADQIIKETEKLEVPPIPDAQKRIADSLRPFWERKCEELVYINEMVLNRDEPDYLKKLSDLTMAQMRLLDYMMRFAKACAGEIDAAKEDRDQTEDELKIQAELLAKTRNRTAKFFKE